MHGACHDAAPMRCHAVGPRRRPLSGRLLLIVARVGLAAIAIDLVESEGKHPYEIRVELRAGSASSSFSASSLERP